jgi:hypothetical protein
VAWVAGAKDCIVVTRTSMAVLVATEAENNFLQIKKVPDADAAEPGSVAGLSTPSPDMLLWP